MGYTTHIVSGSNTLSLPNQTLQSTFDIKFTNTLTSAVNISLAGLVKPPKTPQLLQAREDLKAAGIPVGRSFDALKGFVATMIDTAIDANNEGSKAEAAAIRSGNVAALDQIQRKKK